MELSISAIISGVLIAIILNVLVWAYAWGRTIGSINTKLANQDVKIKELKEKHDKDFQDLTCKIHQVHLEIIPECRDSFQGINEKLANVEGNVNAILHILEKYQPKKG
ncbi:hypothetical protein [Dehalococcoides mccartyi]|jgi:hypothetical protein|uniref:hypothetical protein n=1 Tax=Dehalococcoides mccartyi TaxID=61435 RepID=UPI0006BDC1D7|nr:hypothetical protein [Dehalococcoides mccartyi]BAS31219.1 hypothetical protein IBK_0144 [Dehalococcoides mccartyi IBARAKI]